MFAIIRYRNYENVGVFIVWATAPKASRNTEQIGPSACNGVQNGTPIIRLGAQKTCHVDVCVRSCCVPETDLWPRLFLLVHFSRPLAHCWHPFGYKWRPFALLLVSSNQPDSASTLFLSDCPQLPAYGGRPDATMAHKIAEVAPQNVAKT